MAGVPFPARVAALLVAYAAFAVGLALGLGPSFSGDGSLALLLIMAFPFALGALIARPWVAFAVFAIVLATWLLPDRTVVETTANSVTYRVNATSFAPTCFFAIIAAFFAHMGASMRLWRRAAV